MSTSTSVEVSSIPAAVVGCSSRSSAPEPDFFDSLPSELLLATLKHLTVADLAALRNTNSHMREIVDSAGSAVPLIRRLYLSLWMQNTTAIIPDKTMEGAESACWRDHWRNWPIEEIKNFIQYTFNFRGRDSDIPDGLPKKAADELETWIKEWPGKKNHWDVIGVNLGEYVLKCLKSSFDGQEKYKAGDFPHYLQRKIEHFIKKQLRNQTGTLIAPTEDD